MIRTILALLFAVSMGFTVVGCGEEEPTPGEALDNAIEETEDATEEAAEETGDALNEAADTVEDATE